MPDDKPPADVGHDFEAAKVVFEALKPLPKPAQERVLRWVAESLGITPHSPVAAPTTPARATSHEQPAANPAPVIPAAEQATDIATFVKQKNPRTDIQFVTAAAYYYQFIAPTGQRRATIDAETAQNATRLADWDRLTDPRSTLNNAKKQGYLDSGERGEYSINTVGENLVARTLPAGEETPQRRGSKRSSGVKKKREIARGKKKTVNKRG
jgi:hypothetical protein